MGQGCALVHCALRSAVHDDHGQNWSMVDHVSQLGRLVTFSVHWSVQWPYCPLWKWMEGEWPRNMLLIKREIYLFLVCIINLVTRRYFECKFLLPRCDRRFPSRPGQGKLFFINPKANGPISCRSDMVKCVLKLCVWEVFIFKASKDRKKDKEQTKVLVLSLTFAGTGDWCNPAPEDFRR